MDKVSIVTRAFNRLEYTTTCVDSLIKNTNYDNYEHIIINNNSKDGTKDWLDWVKNNIPFFNKVVPVHLEKNLGDWGGMLESYKYISADSKYIVQLDNDVVINDPEWLNKLIFMLNNTPHKIVQLKRKGVGTVIQLKNRRTIKYGNEELIYGNINRPVACFMLRTDDFKNLLPKLKNSSLSLGKTLLSNFLGGTVKIENLNCHIIDGFDGKDSYLNYQKYNPNLTNNGENIIQIMK